jgi:DNA-binding response OmpR family regulator
MALVLVIDDEPLMRHLMRRTIEEAGHQVVEAPDGEVGMRLFADRRPDLVVTDIYMPNKEGIQTIREMRACEADIPILAVSGGGGISLDFLWMARELGATEALAKPFRQEVFLSAIDRLMVDQQRVPGVASA